MTFELGVLGGMGPEATTSFLKRLIELTPACCDQDHISSVTFMDTKIPDRSTSIIEDSNEPLRHLIKGVKYLNFLGCKYIVMPCNSAHFWFEELQAISNVPILNMPEITIAAAQKSEVQEAELWATDGTISSAIFQKPAHIHNFEICLPDEITQNLINLAIGYVKSGKIQKARRCVQKILDKNTHKSLKASDKTIILGCTELSLLASEISCYNYFDTQECLAHECVLKASIKN